MQKNEGDIVAKLCIGVASYKMLVLGISSLSSNCNGANSWWLPSGHGLDRFIAQNAYAI